MACLLIPPPRPSKLPPIDPTTQMRRIRERLIDSGTYLGTSAIRETVAWRRIGKANKLVLLPEAVSADEVVPPQSPTTTTAEPGSDVDDPPAASEGNADPPEAAILSAVVKISEDDFYLTSDAGYQGPGRYIASFAQVKPSCTGGIPEAGPFRGDYAQVLDNVQWLLNEATTPGFTVKRGFVTGPTTAQRLKVRHVLFEALELDAPEPTSAEEDKENIEPEVDSAGSDTGSDTDTAPSRNAGKKDWTHISNWPVNTDAARAELATMIDTHRVHPIPAYDMRGYLIHPHFYRSRLSGATVELDFELTHWSMKGRNGEPSSDTFTADIVAVRVIVPPKPLAPTPRKRKVCDKMDPLSSPSPRKKVRYF